MKQTKILIFVNEYKKYKQLLKPLLRSAFSVHHSPFLNVLEQRKYAA